MLNSRKIKALIQWPFILALYLFGFLLEFIIELPFMIACSLGRKESKGEGASLDGRTR